MISRREWLAGIGLVGAGAALSAPGVKLWPRDIPGKLLGASHRRGHRLRDNTKATQNSGKAAQKPGAIETIDTGVVIIGAGAAGLSAAWRLHRAGRRDFVVLDLEDVAGGKSVAGEHRGQRFPWGAHYLPAPSSESNLVNELLEEMGVIRGYVNRPSASATPAQKLPVFDDAAVCQAPQARLYRDGGWQRGTIPARGLTSEARAQIARFSAQMAALRIARGADGKRAFAIPARHASTDPRWLALDNITFAAWADGEGYSDPDLRWYLDYCCRDDYGVAASKVSAWAGLHYFASRDGLDQHGNEGVVLTWPQGNAALTDHLRGLVSTQLRAAEMATQVVNIERGVEVTALRFKEGGSVRYRAAAAICCCPGFVAERIVAGRWPQDVRPPLDYAPWAVANVRVHLDVDTSLPSPNRRGVSVPLAWDNVIQGGRSLGYVHAQHQDLAMASATAHLTWYRPMDDGDPAAGRRELLRRTHAQWCDEIVADMARAHPNFADQVERVDVWRWGHGMAIPQPGSVWADSRLAAAKPLGNIHFAHSDLTGISVFEEAQFHGVRAAEEALAKQNSGA